MTFWPRPQNACSQTWRKDYPTCSLHASCDATCAKQVCPRQHFAHCKGTVFAYPNIVSVLKSMIPEVVDNKTKNKSKEYKYLHNVMQFSLAKRDCLCTIHI